ncbi:hypothetical protein BH09VER1_BH09VER1_25200 [soil metagenome]
MAGERSLVDRDGLYPSAKEYAQWQKMVFAMDNELLVDRTTP